MPSLVLPHPRLRETFLEAMAELAAEGRTGDDSVVGQDLAAFGDAWGTPTGFAAYVDQVLRQRTEAPAGFVCSTTWWWVDGAAYVGRVSLRHELTPRLLQVGGHVGYDVRPSRRREGHATAMLAAVLPHARARGIERALVTCDHDNLASCRAIEANGGVLEDRRGAKLRWWVPTAAPGQQPQE